jgi:proteasome accessory factor C
MSPRLVLDAGDGRAPGAPHDVARRLHRLLAILEHLAAVGECALEDLARRFDMLPEDVVTELELAACCGLPPYTPDELIELYVDGDRVVAERVGDLGRPRRLTPVEGFAVAAPARALLAVPGADPGGSLARALGKLEAVLGEDRLVLDIDAPEHLAALRSAVAGARQVEITYASASSGGPSERTVDPYQVVLREGRWYLDGWCHRAAGVRRFQVARVTSVRETGEPAVVRQPRPPELEDPHAFVGGADARPARVAASPQVAWLLERVAVGSVSEREDGRVEATVLVGGERWLERLLLRLGECAEVLDPPELARVGAAGARRALRRYAATAT